MGVPAEMRNLVGVVLSRSMISPFTRSTSPRRTTSTSWSSSRHRHGATVVRMGNCRARKSPSTNLAPPCCPFLERAAMHSDLSVNLDPHSQKGGSRESRVQAQTSEMSWFGALAEFDTCMHSGRSLTRPEKVDLGPRPNAVPPRFAEEGAQCATGAVNDDGRKPKGRRWSDHAMVQDLVREP